MSTRGKIQPAHEISVGAQNRRADVALAGVFFMWRAVA